MTAEEKLNLIKQVGEKIISKKNYQSISNNGN